MAKILHLAAAVLAVLTLAASLSGRDASTAAKALTANGLHRQVP